MEKLFKMVVIVSLIIVCSSITLLAQVEQTSKRKIGYIRQDIPDFEIPPYKGQRYEEMVPYTLDLQDNSQYGWLFKYCEFSCKGCPG